jgi:hypothetical protein
VAYRSLHDHQLRVVLPKQTEDDILEKKQSKIREIITQYKSLGTNEDGSYKYDAKITEHSLRLVEVMEQQIAALDMVTNSYPLFENNE